MTSKRVTIQDVARAAEVSLGTVSNCLNHPDKVKSKTLTKVQTAMHELGFVPNQSARMLAGGTSPVIGLVLPRLDHGMSLQIANGANREAQRHGYNVMICNAMASAAREEDYVRYFSGMQIAGIMVEPRAVKEWRPTPTAAGDTPLVYLGCAFDAPGYYATADTRAQGRLLAEHALTCGARRVCVVGSPDLVQIKNRIKGIRIIEHANPTVEFTYMTNIARNLAADGFEVGCQIAEMPQEERPDFVLCLTDALATGAAAALTGAGFDIPGQIRVAGCDGNPLAWNGPLPLTTCAPPGYEIGRQGVQLIVKQVKQRRKLAEARAHARAAGLPLPEEPAEEKDKPHVALVRPFLLTRQSTVAEGTTNRTASNPQLDLSTYL